MDRKYNISVTCASGVEKVLKSEFNRLGYNEIPIVNGRADLTGSSLDIARLNINLRSADRVFIRVKEFVADDFDNLFDGIKSIRWCDFINRDGKIIVDGKCVKSKLFAVSSCQSIVKKAIVENLKEKYKMPFLPETGEEYLVEFHIFKDTVTVLINTSGVGLHKRGYRNLVGIAPIKETLASSLVLLSDYYYTRPLVDPFCGSGTILIEGAKIALDIPSNINRDFSFCKWKDFDKNAYKLCKEEGLDKIKWDRKIEVFGSDIDKKAIELANHHVEMAGLKGRINLKVCAVKDFINDIPNGTIVTNPPYGERVYDRKEAEDCYKDLRVAFDKLDNYSLFLITSAKNFEKCFGKKCDRERKLYNSNKECKFYYYYKNKEKILR